MIIVKVLGGLGNQMFQYSLYRALREMGKEVSLDITSFDNYDLHNGYELERLFKNLKLDYADVKDVVRLADVNTDLLSRLRRKVFGSKKSYYIERKEETNINILKSDNEMYLEGYWQSENYFKDIERIIRDEFEFSELTDERNKEISKIIEKKESVSVHIRRGDYVNHPLYEGICTIEYYNRAIRKICEYFPNATFFVFSNDITWCKENIEFENDVYYVDWNKESMSYRDMHLMTLCNHNIIANSSFSWWGAWLNNNEKKVVIAPKKWFSDETREQNQIIPSNWEKI